MSRPSPVSAVVAATVLPVELLLLDEVLLLDGPLPPQADNENMPAMAIANRLLILMMIPPLTFFLY
jgi:hypothetical protein